MLNLSQIESDLTLAMKAKNQTAVDVLRGLKTRIQNEQISKATAADGKKELSETDVVALIRSEVKKRREAAAAFSSGGRSEMAEKELAEAVILEKYLPAQMSESDLSALIETVVTQNNFVAKDFGQAMGKLKAQVGDKADGATLAKLLKEKLK